MNFTERCCLLAFGLFSWITGMFTAATTTSDLTAACAPMITGMGAAWFVVALLPGRMARFSS